MSITPLPTPPSRQDPINFADRADEFLGALPAFATQANGLEAENAAAATAAAQAVLTSKLDSTNPNYTGTLTGGTGVVNLGSGQFYKAADGSVGVGTSSPATNLHVKGATNGWVTLQRGNDASNIAWQSWANADGSNKWGLGMLNSSNSLSVFNYSRGEVAGIFDPAGNFGLGVTPVTGGGKLQLANGQNITFQGAFGNIVTNAAYTDTWRYITNAGAAYYFQNAGTHNWQVAPSGTAGNPISFTQAMTLDANGNLAVGITSTPGGRLTVNRAVSGATDYATEHISIFNSQAGASGNQATLGFHLNNADWGSQTTLARVSAVLENGTTGATALAFGTAANGSAATPPERARIDSAGNFGLGVTPSAWSAARKALQVGQASIANSTAANDVFELSANRFLDSDTTDKYIGNGYATVYQQGSGAHTWYTAPSGTAGNPISFTQAMTLNAAGVLLIGATSAAGSEALRVYNSTNARITVDQASNGLIFGADSSGPFFDTSGSNRLAFFMAGSEKMRLDSSGNLLVGTTSNPTSAKLVVEGKTTIGGALHEKKATIAASDIDVGSASLFTRTITANTTFTVSNVPASGVVASFILDLTNGGSATVTWWAGVKWAGGTAPALTASGRDVLGFFTHDGGTTWTGMMMVKDAK